MSSFNVIGRLRNALRRFQDSQQLLANGQQAELRAIRTQMNAGYDDPRHANYVNLLDTIFSDGRHADPLFVGRYSASIYSQIGEDGIIAEIFNRIGRRNRFFVEIGVEDGSQNTTRFLLEAGWTGVWIEGSRSHADAARKLMQPQIESGQLKIIHASVTAENINDLFDQAAVPNEIDYLSIDIDYNTPHVWLALKRQSRVACIEYNGHLPSNIAMSVPYDAAGMWDGRTIWFGGSLKTMENIGTSKDMALVGCDLSGINSFFVSRNEASGKFREPFTSENHFQRARAHSILPPPSRVPDHRPPLWIIAD